MKKKKKQTKTPQRPTVERTELNVTELQAVLDRVRAAGVSTEDVKTLSAAIDTLGWLTQEIEARGASIRRLRQLLFGNQSEKKSAVFGDTENEKQPADERGQAETPAPSDEEPPKKKKKRKGHGRNGHKKYTGARREPIEHPDLKQADQCPECLKGKVYKQPEPKRIIRITGVGPLTATIWEMERFRCNLCGTVFTAPTPQGIGEEKYDESAASMIALLKYGCGLPFYRIETLGNDLGIPLPSATQWEVVDKAYEAIAPAFHALIVHAAQGKVLHNDDTSMKVLDIIKENERKDKDKERTGINTTGIVSVVEGRKIALFFTGRCHAGENLEQVLKQRAAELEAPLQMCDAIPANTAGDFQTIVANCLTHGRRKFVEILNDFPDEARRVIEDIALVYKHDGQAKEENYSDEERLHFHQVNSKPIMDALKQWIEEQFAQKMVEDNSNLGKAYRYLLNHWQKLTRFLTVPGAPLDNNICERALKKIVLHRKNSLFFKTRHGAEVGDAFMSLIHTAELENLNPFEYLKALQTHSKKVIENPQEWLPGNYQETLQRIKGNPEQT